MKNITENTNIYNIYQQNIYQEGVFDRVGARLKGLGNTKLFGGTGYNAGKADSFKEKLKQRIIKDIDKFLKEVQGMGNVRTLEDFEVNYPEMARKIACMADAVGHRTPLRTTCQQGEKKPQTPDNIKPKPEPTPGPTPGPTPEPTPGRKPATYTCRPGGECKRRYDGKGRYKSKEDCEANCGAEGGGGGGGGSRRPGGRGDVNQSNTVGGNNYGNMANVSGEVVTLIQTVINKYGADAEDVINDPRLSAEISRVTDDRLKALGITSPEKRQEIKDDAIANVLYTTSSGGENSGMSFNYSPEGGLSQSGTSTSNTQPGPRSITTPRRRSPSFNIERLRRNR